MVFYAADFGVLRHLNWLLQTAVIRCQNTNLRIWKHLSWHLDITKTGCQDAKFVVSKYPTWGIEYMAQCTFISPSGITPICGLPQLVNSAILSSLYIIIIMHVSRLKW
jgi:hypothetical protein